MKEIYSDPTSNLGARGLGVRTGLKVSRFHHTKKENLKNHKSKVFEEEEFIFLL